MAEYVALKSLRKLFFSDIVIALTDCTNLNVLYCILEEI